MTDGANPTPETVVGFGGVFGFDVSSQALFIRMVKA